MGKARLKSIRKKARILLENYPDGFTTDFEKNKEFLNKLELPLTKQPRNMIAAEIVNILKNKKD